MFDSEMTAESPECRPLRTGIRRREDCDDCTLWDGPGSKCDVRTFLPDTLLINMGMDPSEEKPFTDVLKDGFVNRFRMITDSVVDRMNHLIRRRTSQRSEAIIVKMT